LETDGELYAKRHLRVGVDGGADVEAGAGRVGDAGRWGDGGVTSVCRMDAKITLGYLFCQIRES